MIAALGLIAASCARDDLDTRRVRAAVVTIEASGCSLVAVRGVGISVGEPGTVVTVAHTIAGATGIEVIDQDGAVHEARVSLFDPRSDIVVLSVADVSSPGLGLSRAQAGESAAVLVTRPGAGIIGVSATVEKFIAVTIEDIYREQTVTRAGLELSAEIRRGDSGAAVIDRAGDVVGIVYARSRQRTGVAFALDDTEIRRAIESATDTTVANGRCR